MILRVRDADGNVQEIIAIRGESGKDGADGKDGVDGRNGIDGINGIDGKDGADGKDYVLTEADKQEIAQMVYAMLPSAEGVEY
jgi:hypothetical protein